MTVGAEEENILSRVVVSIAVKVVDLKNRWFHIPPTSFASALRLFDKMGFCFSPIANVLRGFSTCARKALAVAVSCAVFLVPTMRAYSRKLFAAICTLSGFWEQGRPGTFHRAKTAFCRPCPSCIRPTATFTDPNHIRLSSASAVEAHDRAVSLFGRGNGCEDFATHFARSNVFSSPSTPCTGPATGSFPGVFWVKENSTAHSTFGGFRHHNRRTIPQCH